MFLMGEKAFLADVSAKIVENAEDAVVAIDRDHSIILFNEMAERIFGYTRSEVLGEHLNILLPERFHLQHDLMISEFGMGNTKVRHMSERSRQIYGRRKDGNEFICSVAIMRAGSKSNPVFAAMIRDISENKKTEEELIRLAATDPLTGAFNRREFTALAEREAQRSRRYNRPLSVMIMDLDHFKRLNDTYGHAAGDKALQKFTTLCCNLLRNVDIFGRWGGEEFVILLPETNAEGAAIIAERLRQSIEDSTLTYNDHKIKLTVSIGVAEFRENETGLDEPLGRADAAAYDAKKAGRNRIAVYRS